MSKQHRRTYLLRHAPITRKELESVTSSMAALAVQLHQLHLDASSLHRFYTDLLRKTGRQARARLPVQKRRKR